MPAQPSLIAVDTGGTFTDFFVILGSPLRPQVKIHKVLSTPKDPSQAILQGLKDLGFKTRAKEKLKIIHGSTVATNAFLEGKGARVVLVTTAGFEDVLEIGRQNRGQLYALHPRKAKPMVPASRRLGVLERLNADGSVTLKLSPGELTKLKQKIKTLKPEAIAVCLLHAYANPIYEKQIAKALSGLKIPLSLSHEICPEYREFERSATTCLNAYVTPIMANYLKRLKTKLPHPIQIMQSNGGTLSTREASEQALCTLLSGPAGGALGAATVTKQAGLKRAITLDMGGTSTDLALINDGLEYTTMGTLQDIPIKTPMIRIDTIGAGGGSLAWVDSGGALRVGPKSAGAVPGPLCYNQGGTQLTLTDAHVYLGRLPSKYFLGGQMELKPQKILAPLKKLSRRLQLSMEETAQGIITVANHHMLRALRVLSLERGLDPRDFSLIPFGGAGALHACELAELLEIPQVLVPHHPGILSAYGMAHAPWRRDWVKTLLWRAEKNTYAKLKTQTKALLKQAHDQAKAAGIKSKDLNSRASLDLRYQGQSFEINTALTLNYLKDFAKKHQQRYGFTHDQPVEIVNLRLQVETRASTKDAIPKKPTPRKPNPISTQTLHYQGKTYTAGLYLRESFKAGDKILGPAIIAELSATTLLPPHWSLSVDTHRNLRLKRS